MPSKWLLVALAGSALLCLAACGSDSEASSTGAERLDVVTTIYSVTYFTERVGGDLVEIRTLINPGVEAHDFEPSTGDLRALDSADLVVYASDAFEMWMPGALGSTGNEGRIVVAAADIEVGDLDPHVWLDPNEAIGMVERIRDGLQAADPEHAQIFAENASSVVDQLMDVKTAIATKLVNCGLDAVVVSHRAFGHLLEPLGVKQIGLSGVSAEVESGPRTVAGVIDDMREMGIEYVLQEPVSSSRAAEAVAAETGATVLPLHPLEALTPEEVAAGEDYFSVMERNVENLAVALECGS